MGASPSVEALFTRRTALPRVLEPCSPGRIHAHEPIIIIEFLKGRKIVSVAEGLTGSAWDIIDYDMKTGGIT